MIGRILKNYYLDYWRFRVADMCAYSRAGADRTKVRDAELAYKDGKVVSGFLHALYRMDLSNGTAL